MRIFQPLLLPIGTIFDRTVSMKEHVHTICRSCYCHIRNIGCVRSLTKEATIRLIHAFISSKVDHLNGLLYGIPKYLLHKLPMIQNNAAQIVTKSKRRDHITPIFSKPTLVANRKENWLWKNLLLTFKAQHGLAPGYICDLITPYQPHRALHSLNLLLLKNPHSRTKSYGDRTFAVCSPYLWNKLPLNLRQLDELEGFKTEIKTNLFKQAFPEYWCANIIVHHCVFFQKCGHCSINWIILYVLIVNCTAFWVICRILCFINKIYYYYHSGLWKWCDTVSVWPVCCVWHSGPQYPLQQALHQHG